MKTNIKTLLRDEIATELENLKGIPLGTTEYETTVNGLTKLMDRSIEMDKIEVEVDKQYIENDLKIKQMGDENKDRLIRNGIAVAGIVIPSLLTVWGTIKSIKFEQEGTITTIMGRGFINKLLPKK